jgi:lantibiotic modifying enzyme
MAKPSMQEVPLSGPPPVSERTLSSIRGLLRPAALRYRDLSKVSDALRKAEESRGVPRHFRGRTWETAYGYPGIALFLQGLHQAFPGEGWDGRARDCLRAAARDALSLPAACEIGLLGGVSGLAWVLQHSAPLYGRNWERTRTLEDLLLLRIRREMDRSQGASGFASHRIDFVNGVTGSGVYLLSRSGSSRAREMLGRVLDFLMDLVRPDGRVPRWHIPAEHQPDDKVRKRHPRGTLATGMAHGISGILGLLALASLSGIQRPELETSIRRIISWLSSYQGRRPGTWPKYIPVEASGRRSELPAPAFAASWCTGAAGIAGALWLAGVALKDPGPRKLAIRAAERMCLKLLKEASAHPPMFCHGAAGTLEVVLRFWQHTRRPVFQRTIEALASRLVAQWDPKLPFGFRSSGRGDGRPIDDPGLLEGAAGILLVLLTVSGGAGPAWDRLFLLS